MTLELSVSIVLTVIVSFNFGCAVRLSALYILDLGRKAALQPLPAP